MLVYLLVTVLVLAQEDPANEPWRVSRAALLGEIEACLRTGRERRSALAADSEVRSWQAAVEERIGAACSPRPPADRAPPKVGVVRRLQRADYAIEHLLIETRPRMHVSAHLYLPDAERFPPPVAGVLVACGHTKDGKAYPDYQRAGALLARHGMAALVFDPLDQGERVQALNENGAPVHWGTSAHNISGAKALLLGWSQAGLEAWDGTRCLDALSSRPEVDPARLGVCGQSGGGTQSAQLFALDERLKVAAPSCYVTSFASLARTIGPQDAEQNLYAQIRDGIDHADYLAVRAPAPALVTAVREDFFPIAGTRATVEEARGVYAALGASDRIALVEADGEHRWAPPLVEATVAWMARWLDGREIEPVYDDAVPMTAEEARVTPAGQVRLLERERSLHAFLEERARTLARTRNELTREERLRLARSLAGIRALEALEAPELRLEEEENGIERLRAVFADGIELPAARLPAETSARVPLLVIGVGAWSAPAPELVEDREILRFDPLALGDATPKEGHWYGSFGPVGHDAAYGLLLGRPIVGRQAEEILAFVRALDRPVELHARGPAALAALHAAAFEPELFTAVDVEAPIRSWEDLLAPSADLHLLPLVVPGALAAYDLPDL